MNTQEIAELPDSELLEKVQRQSFDFFWFGAHATSGLALDRRSLARGHGEGSVATGGSGFAVMALLVGVERGWISRNSAAERLLRMLDLLSRATRYHGAFPHFLNGENGSTIAFGPRDDGGDLVETSFLMMGLLCARQYFAVAGEAQLRERINRLWETVEWNWYTQGKDVLTWHWSANYGWAINHAVRGWNETLITYVLAASSPSHAIHPRLYHSGFAAGPQFQNGNTYYGTRLPLGPHLGGPLFFAHYSFCGLDPRGLSDIYADYWEQNRAHVAINRAYCIANPKRFKGYSGQCWGITASDDPRGYDAHAPSNDNGTISPTAALSSLPYAPGASLQAIRHFLTAHGSRIWNRFGFTDAFNETEGWYADTYLAIDQGPIILMIENYRSGLLWKLFMAVPEVQAGLKKLGFRSAQV